MIIRSQDKKRIININQITNISTMLNSRLGEWEVYVCYPYSTDEDCGYSTIAYYSTEEKAIKVLDMIQSAYNSIETMKIDKKAWRDNHYFQMPQDSEVQNENEKEKAEAIL